MKKGGCWIFLSHSSHDIEKVRIIRNEFEKYTHNPLAFHLRCLNDDTPEGKQELDSLIKREIDCREWFVFCESPAVDKSSYVQMEKNYIKEKNKRKVWSIDMSLPIEEIIAKVKKICTLIKVYICFSRKDGLSIFKALERDLLKKDFDVWDNESGLECGFFSSQIKKAIHETVDSGFVIILVTEHFSKSDYCMKELEFILESKAQIIPLIFGDAEIPDALIKHKCYRIPEVPSENDINLIVELVEAALKTQIHGPMVQSDAYNKISKINEKLNYKKRYHSQDAVFCQSTDAYHDYCEIYKFPCCGLTVMVGDGPLSRYRADGCCCDDE